MRLQLDHTLWTRCKALALTLLSSVTPSSFHYGLGLISVFLLSFVHIAIARAEASDGREGYCIEGLLRYEAFQANGTNVFRARKFKVTVQNCLWVIESTDVATGEYEMNTQADGSMHSVTKVNPTKDPKLNDYFQILENNDVPPPTVSGNSILWLAFASSCYLKSIKDAQFEPVWLLDDPNLRKEHFKTHGLLETLDGFLPRRLAYLNEGTIIATSAGRRVTIQAGPSFHGAITNAFYHALMTTNFGNIQIPVSFEFQRFGISPNFTTHLITKISATVTNVEKVPQLAKEMPSLKGVIFNNDCRNNGRQPNAAPITYRSTNAVFVLNTNFTTIEHAPASH